MAVVRFAAKVGDAIKGLATSPAFWSKAVVTGAVAASQDREYDVLGEDFTVSLNLEPKEFTKRITDPTIAIASTIYVGTIYNLQKRLEIQRRAINVARALQVIADQGDVLSATYTSIADDVDLLAREADFGEARKIMDRVTAKSLKAQRLSRAMEVDINAVLYLNRAGADDQLLAELREYRGGLDPGDIKVWQNWIDNPPKAIPDDLIAILKQLADPDDLFGIKQTVNQAKAANQTMIELTTRSEAFIRRGQSLMEAWARLPPADIDELGRALKSLQQGDLATSFNTAADDMTKLIPKLGTISGASQEARAIGIKSARFAKGIGRFLFWDTVYWVVTGGLDIALNPFVPEDKQRIPYLADLPVIGGLFDVSESAGTSPLNLVIEWGLGNILDWFIPDSVAASFYDLLDQAVDTDDLSAWLLLALTWWYDLGFDITLDDLAFEIPDLSFETNLPIPVGDLDPLDILSVAVVACVGKIVFKGWVMPAWKAFSRSAF